MCGICNIEYNTEYLVFVSLLLVLLPYDDFDKWSLLVFLLSFFPTSQHMILMDRFQDESRDREVFMD